MKISYKFIILFLIILSVFNIIYHYIKKTDMKRIYISYFKPDVININLNGFKTLSISNNSLKKGDNRLIYFIRFDDCKACIYELNETLDYFIQRNVSINMVFIHNNYEETIKYIDEFYFDYVNKINFYFSDEKTVISNGIVKQTPIIYGQKNNKIVFQFTFNFKIDDLYKIYSYTMK